MGGEVTLKLPFILGHMEDVDDNGDGQPTASTTNNVIEEEECETIPLFAKSANGCTAAKESRADPLLPDRNRADVTVDSIVAVDDTPNEERHIARGNLSQLSHSINDDDAADDEDEQRRQINVITAQIHTSAI